MSGGGQWGFASSQTTRQKLGRYGMKRNPWAFTPVTTGYSTADQGRVTIDPSIRAIQDRGLENINSLYGQAGQYGDELISNARGLRQRFMGNESDFKQSLINPILAQVAQRRGEVQRSIGQRGLAGSSFGEQAITNFDVDTQRQIQDARSQAEMANLQALTGIDQRLSESMFTKIFIQSQLNNESQNIAQARLRQELSALGIGQQQADLMVKAFEGWQNRMLNNLQDVAHTDNISYGSGGSSSPSLGGTSGGSSGGGGTGWDSGIDWDSGSGGGSWG